MAANGKGGKSVAKIIVSKDVLGQFRQKIAAHGTAILADEGDTEEYLVQAAGGFIEPEDDVELAIVMEAASETDQPLLTPSEARTTCNSSGKHFPTLYRRRPWLRT